MKISEITYQGNKTRFMKILKPLIEANLDDDMVYIEPFGGGMNSFTPINSAKKIANDVNEYNIALWKELKEKGFDGVEAEWSKYFNILSNCEDKPEGENYLKAKLLYLDMKHDCLTNGGKYPKALLGFVAYSCSFGGSWWNGFVGYNERRGENYVKEAIAALKKHATSSVNMDKSEFIHGNYDAIDVPDNAFIYCDPPYSGTKQYSTNFDNDSFWEWCRDIINEKDNVKILVSEYSAPSDFVCIWKQVTQDKMGSNSQNKTEKLFIHNSQVSQFNLSTLANNLMTNKINEMKFRLTENELKNIVAESVKCILENIEDELTTYHGSSAAFDNFDLGFVGSGEGSQVYGYGVYLTDVKDTGRWYAASIALKNASNDNGNFKRGVYNKIKGILNPKVFPQGLSDKTYDYGKKIMIDKLSNSLKSAKQERVKKEYETALNFVMDLNSYSEYMNAMTKLAHEAATPYKRFVYEVDIPDNGYIDWNDTNMNFIHGLFKKFSEKFDTSHVDINTVTSFGDLYEKLRGWVNKRKGINEIIPQKELSEYLYSLGFNGIRVPTGNKNGGDGRGENYVLFNDKDVKIINRIDMTGKEDF